MGKVFDYAVAFEGIDDGNGEQIYSRGEMEFYHFGAVKKLGEKIREMLNPLGQKFVAGKQRGVRIVPKRLWKIEPSGSRTEIPLPEKIAEEERKWKEHVRAQMNAIAGFIDHSSRF